MRSLLPIAVLWMLMTAGTVQAAPKPHVISFGRPVTVKLLLGTAEDKSVDIRVRPMYVDGRLKDFTTGTAHDITPQTFAIRQAFRVNDSLPNDARTEPKWKWQRGVWLLVDRLSGRVSALKLPDFDTFYSTASWYRDYAAYCGTSDNGEKLYAMVAQLGRKRPIVRKELGDAPGGDQPDAECDAPQWQRQPARVTFFPRNGQKLTFDVRGRPADLAPAETEAKEEESN